VTVATGTTLATMGERGGGGGGGEGRGKGGTLGELCINDTNDHSDWQKLFPAMLADSSAHLHQTPLFVGEVVIS
jgi:hypothetical protein